MVRRKGEKKNMITERLLKRIEEAGHEDDLAAIVDFIYDVDNAIIQAFYRDRTVATLQVLKEVEAIASFVKDEIMYETNYSTIFSNDEEGLMLTIFLGEEYEK